MITSKNIKQAPKGLERIVLPLLLMLFCAVVMVSYAEPTVSLMTISNVIYPGNTAVANSSTQQANYIYVFGFIVIVMIVLAVISSIMRRRRRAQRGRRIAAEETIDEEIDKI